VDERRHEHRVDPELEATQEPELAGTAEQKQIQDRQNTDAGCKDEEGSPREWQMLLNGRDSRRAQKEDGEEKPKADQPLDPLRQRVPLSLAIGIDVRH
jgi:hypothetical protein